MAFHGSRGGPGGHGSLVIGQWPHSHQDGNYQRDTHQAQYQLQIQSVIFNLDDFTHLRPPNYQNIIYLFYHFFKLIAYFYQGTNVSYYTLFSDYF
jgi:hypothetical protein